MVVAHILDISEVGQVPEFIDPAFTKTSPKRSFSVIQNERFGLVFAKGGSIISGTGVLYSFPLHSQTLGLGVVNTMLPQQIAQFQGRKINYAC